VTAADVVHDVVLLVFDRAVKYARARIGVDDSDDVAVTREDLRQAVIELRFDRVALTLQQLDVLRELHDVKMRELHARLDAERERGDVPDTQIVDLDGTEEFRPVFTPRKK